MRNRFFRCQLPLMIGCGFLPIPLMMCHFWARADLLPWLVAPAAYLILSCVCMLLPGKWRLAAAIPGLVAMVAASSMMLAGETPGVRITLPALYAGLLLFTLPIAGWERGRELPQVIPAVAVCAHLLAQFLFFVNPTQIKAISPLLWISFVIFLLLFMLSLNRQSISSSMPDEHDVPVSIRKRNRLLTWIMLGVVMVISLIPALGKAVNQVMTWIKQLVLFLVDLFLKLFASEESSGSGGGGAEDMLSGLGGGEASAFAKWLEKIFVAITVVLLTLIVLRVIRFLWRKLKQLAIYLYGQLRHYASSASEDYIDEIEDTRSEGEGRVSFAQQILRRRNARRNLKDLPPREQIRVRYSMLRGKHPEWEQSHTARETLNETSARLYEKARYSSHEVTVQDSETFAEQQGK